MELQYPGKQSRDHIIERAQHHAPLTLDGQSALIFGDNVVALSRLLTSDLRGKIDLIYIDPPYNTNQEFTFSDDRVRTVSRGAKTHLAYSDNMTPAAYLEFMRERLILMHELLSPEGSLYVHIDTKMGHYLKIILDEIFGVQNFKNDIARIKSNPKNFARTAYGNQRDMILFYAKNAKKNIFNNITIPLNELDKARMFKKIDSMGRRYNTVPVHAPGETVSGKTGGPWRGVMPPAGRHWRTDPAELDKLDAAGLIEWSRNDVPRLKKYADEHKGKKIQDIWDYVDPAYPVYPTEKSHRMLEMIVAQSSHKNSYVLDCFAGSGSTLLAAEKLGRRWIGVDQSAQSARIMCDRLKDKPHLYIEL